MPHIDELLGVATVAATGLLAAILLQPARTTEHFTAHASAPTLTVEVVARRTIEEPSSIARERAGSEAGVPTLDRNAWGRLPASTS